MLISNPKEIFHTLFAKCISKEVRDIFNSSIFLKYACKKLDLKFRLKMRLGLILHILSMKVQIQIICFSKFFVPTGLIKVNFFQKISKKLRLIYQNDQPDALVTVVSQKNLSWSHLQQSMDLSLSQNHHPPPILNLILLPAQ